MNPDTELLTTNTLLLLISRKTESLISSLKQKESFLSLTHTCIHQATYSIHLHILYIYKISQHLNRADFRWLFWLYSGTLFIGTHSCYTKVYLNKLAKRGGGAILASLWVFSLTLDLTSVTKFAGQCTQD